MTGAVLVVRPGPLSLVQDAGRPGLAQLGVGRSGAADRTSYALANRLVGNVSGAAAIECTLGGLVLRADGDQVLVVTGAPAPATVDGRPVDHGAPTRLRSGETLKLRAPRSGLRSYLAVRGGIDVPTVLGSRSSDTLSGIGPAALAAGDRLAVGAEIAGPAEAGCASALTEGAAVVLRVVLGPRADWFVDPADLAAGTWLVSARSNRVGLRLDRPDPAAIGGPGPPTLRRIDSRELPSEGIALGAVQVPPSGQPVLFLADHPVTGGYPVIAVVRDGDVDAAAQARPGRLLQFHIDSDIRA